MEKESPPSPPETATPAGQPFKYALGIMLTILAAMAAASFKASQTLPPNARIPIHWNIKGEADGFAGPEGLWILVKITGVMIALWAAFPFLSRKFGNTLKSSIAYSYPAIATVGLMAVIHGVLISAALGKEISMNRWICFASGVQLIVLCNFMGKAKPNKLFGVRNRWTFHSDLSWRKANRLGGKLGVLVGVMFFLAAVLDIADAAMIPLLVGLIIFIAVIPTWYSCEVWKNDPDARPLDD